MLKIQIKDATVTEREVKGMRFRDQTGWIEFPSGEVRKMRVPVPRGGEPYKTGIFTVADSSFEVGQWGDLQIGRNLELLPVAASVGSAKATTG